MLDCGRPMLGWQPWLTPRQTWIIDAKLHGREISADDDAELAKLQEWFAAEAEIKRKKYEVKK